MARTGKLVINKVEKFKSQPPNTATTTATIRSNLQKPTLMQRFEFVLALLNRLLIGFVTIYMCWMCLRLQRHEIPWHAVLCTFGFVCLMSEGLLAHYRSNAWTQLCYRPEKTRTHWLLQLIGSLIGLAGIVIKIALERSHFHTLHGKLGLSTFVLCFISLLSGLSSLYATELKARVRPLINKAFHAALGLATYTLAMLGMLTAFETDVFLEHSLDAAHYVDFRQLLQVMIVLILVLSSYGPFWCFFYSKLWN